MHLTAQLFKRLAGEGKCILLITHDMDLIAKAADSVLYLEQGKVRYHRNVLRQAQAYPQDISSPIFACGKKHHPLRCLCPSSQNRTRVLDFGFVFFAVRPYALGRRTLAPRAQAKKKTSEQSELCSDAGARGGT